MEKLGYDIIRGIPEQAAMKTAVGPGVITALLRQVADGDKAAEERLLEALFGELRRMAARHLRRERPDHTLQPTELLNEVYIRLLGSEKPQRWTDRQHFFAVASTAMRRLLVDYSRRRTAAKRNGGLVPLPEDHVAFAISVNHSPERILAVDAVLTQLAQIEPRQARIVELRFFSGFTDEQTASLLDISTRTVKRDWAAAKEWLYARLASDSHDDDR
jgi:RNA polymerase sigma-70 factor (ECF subfamily)